MKFQISDMLMLLRRAAAVVLAIVDLILFFSVDVH